MTARITGASTVELSEPIRSGAQFTRVVNASARAREFKFQRMPAGLTALAFLAQPRESEPGIDWGGLSDVPPGAALVTTIDFEPSEYVLGTWPAIRHETSRALIDAGRGRGDR